MSDFNAYVDTHADRFLRELMDLVRQPSIAAQNIGLRETASLVRARLERVGASVELIDMGGDAPIVLAELADSGLPANAPTLMIYNHYDVQPPDPLDLWTSPPFEPTIRDGKLYARGVADNKGNLLARIQAVEAWQATRGPLPIRLRWVIEGEEEISSVHLEAFAEQYADRLRQADGCLWESGERDPKDRPVMRFGLKGICYVELRARGAVRDIHSSDATLVVNPAWRLVWALSTLKNEQDTITIDGFHEHVMLPPPETEALLDDIPFEEEAIKRNYGIERFINHVTGRDALYKRLFTPTCTICGFQSGYTGVGSKTVLPSTAMVKLDFRLVPNLLPETVIRLLRAHLDRRGFHDIEIVPLGGSPSSRSSPNSRVGLAARRAVEIVYGQKPVLLPNTPGSGPMYHLSDRLGVPVVSSGCGYAYMNLHSPDENIRISDYFLHLKFMGELIQQFAIPNEG